MSEVELHEHTYARASRLDIQYYGNTGPALARRKVKTIPHDNKSGNVFQPERYEILRCMRQDTRVTREQDMLTCGNGARFYFLAATSITPPPLPAAPRVASPHSRPTIAGKRKSRGLVGESTFSPSFVARFLSRAQPRAEEDSREVPFPRYADHRKVAIVACVSLLLPDTICFLT